MCVELFKIQAVVGQVGVRIFCKILDPINRMATDAIFTELLKDCTDEDLTGANDVRNFEKTRMVTDVICTCRAIWEYLDSGLVGMKDQNEPFKDDDFLAIGKLLSTTIEDLVLAFTLTSEQFEDPVMWGAVEAMNRYFETGLAQHAKPGDGLLRVNHKESDAKTQLEKPKGKGRGKGAGAPAPPSRATLGGSLGVQYTDDGRTLDASGQETAQSAARSEAKADMEKNYVCAEWSDRTAYMSDLERCNLIGERIRSLMPSKHSLGAVQAFIRNLYSENVDDVLRPGHTIPAMAWKETDGKMRTVQISRKVLSNNKQDRLLKVLEKVLNHNLMPEIEYITGLPEMRNPFVLQTIIPLSVKTKRRGGDGALDFSGVPPGVSSGSSSMRPPQAVVRPSFMIRDQTWVDSTVALIVRRAETFSMTDDQKDTAYRKSMPELFRTPYIIIDRPLETFTVYRHLSSSLTNFETLRELGFGDSKQAEKLLIPDTRRQAYEATCHYAISLDYPDCFLSRDPEFLKKEKWRKRSVASALLSAPAPKRARSQILESQSLDELNRHRVPSELSVDISRFQANVNPAYRETTEFNIYETKTRERHDDMAEIHANLTRTRSVPARMADLPVYRPPPVDDDETDLKHVDPEPEAEDKRASEPLVEEQGPNDAEQAAAAEMDEGEDDDSAMLRALHATEKVMPMPAAEPEPELELEPEAEADSEDTRSGFEKSAMATFWKS